MEEKSIIPTGSDPWNISKGFSITHVLIPLNDCRKLVKLSLFGIDEIGIEITEQDKILNRIESISQLYQELNQIVQDTYFVMDKPNKKLMDKIKENLDEVGKVLDGISDISIDQRTNCKEIKINEKHFNLCLDDLRKALSDIKIPLNNKNLIFQSSDDLDLEALKKEIIEGG